MLHISETSKIYSVNVFDLDVHLDDQLNSFLLCTTVYIDKGSRIKYEPMVHTCTFRRTKTCAVKCIHL